MLEVDVENSFKVHSNSAKLRLYQHAATRVRKRNRTFYYIISHLTSPPPCIPRFLPPFVNRHYQYLKARCLPGVIFFLFQGSTIQDGPSEFAPSKAWRGGRRFDDKLDPKPKQSFANTMDFLASIEWPEDTPPSDGIMKQNRWLWECPTSVLESRQTQDDPPLNPFPVDVKRSTQRVPVSKAITYWNYENPCLHPPHIVTRVHAVCDLSPSSVDFLSIFVHTITHVFFQWNYFPRTRFLKTVTK